MAQYKQRQNRFRNERGFEPDEELSAILTKLWELDENKDSRYPLFEFLDEDRVFARETYQTFRALLDNYEMQCGVQEEVTFEEKTENRAFINAIMETEVLGRERKGPSGGGQVQVSAVQSLGVTDVQLGEYEVEVATMPLGPKNIGTAYISAARMNQISVQFNP
ncbi:ENDOU-like protein, partial [Mya arenaria]